MTYFPAHLVFDLCGAVFLLGFTSGWIARHFSK